jgi:hypothetical protein
VGEEQVMILVGLIVTAVLFISAGIYLWLGV